MVLWSATCCEVMCHVRGKRVNLLVDIGSASKTADYSPNDTGGINDRAFTGVAHSKNSSLVAPLLVAAGCS